MKYLYIIVLIALIIGTANAVAAPASNRAPTPSECADQIGAASEVFVSNWLTCDYRQECETIVLKKHHIDPRCAQYVSI